MKIEERITDFLMNDEKIIEEDTVTLLSLGMISNNINESESGFSNFLSKLGLHANSGNGIIQIIGKGSKNIGQLLWYAMKASMGDKLAKKRMIEIANTEISKEEFIDFVLKLDQLTLHILTGPIHAIEAATGWHIGANINKKSLDVVNRINRAINHIEKIISNAAGTLKITLSNILNNLKNLLLNKKIMGEV